MMPHSCLGPYVNCYSMASISLGAGAIVSQGASLCAGTHDIDDVDFSLVVKPIKIGVCAWVASDAFVGPGVSIGDYSVLGARAVLFKSVGAKMVYVGNPAIFVRKRQVES